jgi:hypothetical protein
MRARVSVFFGIFRFGAIQGEALQKAGASRRAGQGDERLY